MARRHFHAHETERMEALDGLPLAAFWQRVVAFEIDTIFAVLIWVPVMFCWHRYVLHEQDVKDLRWDFHEKSNIVVMLLYWGLANYFGNGMTPGKWMMRIRAASLIHERLGLWQSAERALGYGAALLEGGLGFAQFFWDRNRQCAQDRLAETIVVDIRKKSQPPNRATPEPH